MPISSQASKEEGSETIPQGSRPEVGSKRPAPTSWGDEIVQSSWKREAALKALVRHCDISATTGCWNFRGATTNGYGSFSGPGWINQKKVLAHRVSYVAFKGEAIHDGLFVCHRCDNPLCFNPDHLFLGTQSENLLDAVHKGRTMTGERSTSSKYSAADIQNVIRMLQSGLTGLQVHQRTGISRTHISRIKRGYTRKSETASAADLAHARRLYSDEQMQNIADLIVTTKLKMPAISRMTGVSLHVIRDMKRGKSHQRFVKRALERNAQG